MSSFDLNDEDRRKIQEKFGINRTQVNTFHSCYSKIKKDIDKEYLSHLVSVLEKMAREAYSNPLFTVDLKARKEEEKELADVFSSDLDMGSSFTISYPDNLDKKMIRLGIAHELGHLYLCVQRKAKDKMKKVESLCSLFSILALSDKCRFYKEKCQEFNHQSNVHIINDMSLLHNRKQSRYNISRR